MNTEHFKKRLLDEEKGLLADIARAESDARSSRDAEVEDPMDQVVSAEAKARLFQVTSVEWERLQQVRDALQRIEQGTYGKCVDCGKEIDAARLEAVPWTPYCRVHQEKHDREREAPRGSTL
jgi:DnaK suppressor protein